jgi:hypothetical protein
LAMIITCGGNMGIGTGIPVSKLHVNCCISGGATTTVATFGIQDSTGYGVTSPAIELIGTNIGLSFTMGKIAGINDVNSGGSMAFSTGLCAGTVCERMRITSGGLVGIGTVPDTVRLDVKQSATGTSTVNTAFRDSSTNGNALQIWNGNGEARLRAIYYGCPSDQNITFYTVTSGGSEAERMRITSGGVLRFSSVPFNNYHLDTSTTAIAIANGGTISFETFSGLVLVNNMSNGNIGMWMVGAGSTVLVSQVYGAAVGTMAYSGAINGYVWTSNSGATANYGVFAVRTRANA